MVIVNAVAKFRWEAFEAGELSDGGGGLGAAVHEVSVLFPSQWPFKSLVVRSLTVLLPAAILANADTSSMVKGM